MTENELNVRADLLPRYSDLDRKEGTNAFTNPTKMAKSDLPRKVVDRVHIHAQNVHDYFLDHYKEHGWNDLSTFFCVKPQFRKMMVTYDHDFDGFVWRVAVRVNEMTMEEFSHYTIPDRDPRYKNIQSLHQKEDLASFIKATNPASILALRLGVDAQQLPGRWFVFIDANGKLLVYEPFGWIFISSIEEFDAIKNSKANMESLQSSFCKHGAITLAAIQFMNCRNVEIVDNPPTRQQRRHAEREGKPVPVTYKTLVIHPMLKKRPPGVKTDPTNTTALHICRGHFKSYMEGPGLGRYHAHGVYWWSPQVRGNADIGRIEKDYEVEPEA